MQAQEEEMRQNMEELQATQEEMERKRIEQEKIQSELQQDLTMLNALMDTIPDYIYFKDERSRFIRISKSMVKLFNANSPDEVEGKSDFDFHTKENAEKFYNEEQEIMRTHNPVTNRIAHETFEGGDGDWVSVTKMPLFDTNGRVVGTWGVSRIITDLKQAEQKVEVLSKENQEFRAFVQAIDSSTYFTEYTPNGDVVKVNEPFAKLLGKPAADIVGTAHAKLYEQLGVSLTDSISLWSDLSKGAVVQQTVKVMLDEKEVTLSETYSPITNALGEVEKIVCIAVKN